jgi:hypothetical protein
MCRTMQREHVQDHVQTEHQIAHDLLLGGARDLARIACEIRSRAAAGSVER